MWKGKESENNEMEGMMSGSIPMCVMTGRAVEGGYKTISSSNLAV